MIKARFMGLLFAVLFCFSAWGQTATIMGSTADISGAPLVNPTIQVQLVGCSLPNVPKAHGVSIMSSVVKQLSPSGGTVYGNDIITCGSQSLTLYAVTWFNNGQPAGPTAQYRVVEGQTCNISDGTCLPVTFTPPSIQNATGSVCPAGKALSGFTKNFSPVCNLISITPLNSLSLGSVFSGADIKPNINNVISLGDPKYLIAADNSTDDTARINFALSEAQAKNRSVFAPAAQYRITGSLDMRGIPVLGAGPRSTIFNMDAASSADAILISQYSQLGSFQVNGGRQSNSPNTSGDCIRSTTTDPGSTAQLPYNMTLHDLYLYHCKRNGIDLTDAAYTSIYNNLVLDVGLHDIMLNSYNGGGGFQTTSTTMMTNTLGSAPNGYSVWMQDNVNTRIDYNIMEASKGILATGGANRSLEVNYNYAENIIGGQFLNLAGSGGIGLSAIGNRTGTTNGVFLNDVAAWRQWSVIANWFANGNLGMGNFDHIIQPDSTFFDPIVEHDVEIVANPGTPSNVNKDPIFTMSPSWAVVMEGGFVDFTSQVVAAPPVIVVTSQFPDVNLGNGTLHFSVSGGYLQVVVTNNCCSATTFRFLGKITIIPNRQGASYYAGYFAAPIKTNGLAVIGNRAGSGSSGTSQTVNFTNPFPSTPSCYLQVATGGPLASLHYTTNEIDWTLTAPGYVSYSCTETDNHTF